MVVVPAEIPVTVYGGVTFGFPDVVWNAGLAGDTVAIDEFSDDAVSWNWFCPPPAWVIVKVLDPPAHTTNVDGVNDRLSAYAGVHTLANSSSMVNRLTIARIVRLCVLADCMICCRSI